MLLWYPISGGDHVKSYTKEEIDRLQDSLLLIREAGGWSAEEFGDMIGVTKQTIRNIENKKTAMSKTQYIAIRSVLDYELEERKDDTLLASTINLCLNKEPISNEEMKRAQAFVSGASKSGLDKSTTVKGLAALVGMTVIELATVSPLIIGTTRHWLSKMINNNE